MSALKTLIVSYIKKKAISRYELAKSLSSKNQNKSLRRLDCLLETGKCTKEFIEKLLNVLEIPLHEYETAVTLDAIEQEKKERECFKPFIEILIERGGTPIFVMAIFQSHRIILIENNLTHLTDDEELSTIGSLVDERLRASSFLSSMKIRGFRYNRIYNECWVFDQAGQRIGIEKNRHSVSDHAELRIGGKKFPISTFFGRP